MLYVETDTFLHWTGQLSPGLFVTLWLCDRWCDSLGQRVAMHCWWPIKIDVNKKWNETTSYKNKLKCQKSYQNFQKFRNILRFFCRMFFVWNKKTSFQIFRGVVSAWGNLIFSMFRASTHWAARRSETQRKHSVLPGHSTWVCRLLLGVGRIFWKDPRMSIPSGWKEKLKENHFRKNVWF